MESIDVASLDLISLDIISEPCNVATVYTDYERAYKIYDRSSIDSELKSLKIDILSSVSMKGLILPKQKIIGKNVIGYSMDYINGNRITQLNLKTSELLQLFKNISDLLKYYHRHGIILADLNISNILIKTLDEIYFCDVDSCKILDLPYEGIPFLTKYCLDKLGINDLKVDENFDRLSLYLIFLYVILDKANIFSIPKCELYKKLEEKGIEKQKVFIKYLKGNINSFPYLGDIL